MSDATEGHVVANDCSNLRQGDVVELPGFHLTDENGEPEFVATPAGVVVLSQTCDVVQVSKTRCLVAPVLINPSNAALSSARKGQKPLHLYLASDAAEPACCIADMERAVSVLKSQLSGSRLVARYVAESSGSAARSVALRVGRAFSRFPFPDEVYPAFNKLRKQAQDKAGTEGNFGRVLDLVEDLRVSADHWVGQNRSLTLHIVVSEEHLVPLDELDPNWQWTPSRVAGFNSGDIMSRLSLDRICGLLLANLSGDRTTLAHLWRIFGEAVEKHLLAPMLDAEVSHFAVEVLSDTEMTFSQYQRTESLDLEVLSDSKSDSG